MSVLLFGATSLWGQGSGKLTGKILSIKNQPVSGAIVTVLDTVNVTTSKDGTFKFELKDPAKARSTLLTPKRKSFFDMLIADV